MIFAVSFTVGMVPALAAVVWGQTTVSALKFGPNLSITLEPATKLRGSDPLLSSFTVTLPADHCKTWHLQRWLRSHQHHLLVASAPLHSSMHQQKTPAVARRFHRPIATVSLSCFHVHTGARTTSFALSLCLSSFFLIIFVRLSFFWGLAAPFQLEEENRLCSKSGSATRLKVGKYHALERCAEACDTITAAAAIELAVNGGTTPPPSQWFVYASKADDSANCNQYGCDCYCEQPPSGICKLIPSVAGFHLYTFQAAISVRAETRAKCPSMCTRACPFVGAGNCSEGDEYEELLTDDGQNGWCRLADKETPDDTFMTLHGSIWTGNTKLQCKEQCDDDVQCTAFEWGIDDHKCEIWSTAMEIASVSPTDPWGGECYKKCNTIPYVPQTCDNNDYEKLIGDDGRSGSCRLANQVNPNDDFETHNGKESLSACNAKCDADAECTAFEWEPGECEIWSAAIESVNSNDDNVCFKKCKATPNPVLAATSAVRGTSTYTFIATKATWEAARAVCLTFGADLVTFESVEELTFVVDAFVSKSLSRWIGCNDREQEGQFVWASTGTSCNETLADYSNWQPNEPKLPNDHGGEDCVVDYSDYSGAVGTWNDVPCTRSLPYTCEKRTTTTLTTATVTTITTTTVTTIATSTVTTITSSADTPIIGAVAGPAQTNATNNTTTITTTVATALNNDSNLSVTADSSGNSSKTSNGSVAGSVLGILVVLILIGTPLQTPGTYVVVVVVVLVAVRVVVGLPSASSQPQIMSEV
jgi:hypothetical protein